MPSPEKVQETLEQFQVDGKIMDEIYQGFDEITSKTNKKIKSAFFKQALEVMNEKMPADEVQEIFEANACCKSGSREKNSKEFARAHAVSYHSGERFECACPTINKIKRDYAMPREYCYCCGGHFKYHYEIMLGVKLELVEIISSPHDNSGEKPCVFRYAIRES